MGKRRYRWPHEPMLLGKLLYTLRMRYGAQSKYSIEQRAGVDHSTMQFLEVGRRQTLEHYTLLRLATGYGTDGATHAERIALLEAAIVDRLTVEAAKWVIYYLAEIGREDPLLADALASFHDDFLALLAAEAAHDAPTTVTETTEAETEMHDERAAAGSDAAHALRVQVGRRVVDMRTATGLDAVSALAEHPGAHLLRLDILRAVVPRLDLNWGRGRATLYAATDESAPANGRRGPYRSDTASQSCGSDPSAPGKVIPLRPSSG